MSGGAAGLTLGLMLAHGSQSHPTVMLGREFHGPDASGVFTVFITIRSAAVYQGHAHRAGLTRDLAGGMFASARVLWSEETHAFFSAGDPSHGLPEGVAQEIRRAWLSFAEQDF